MKSKTSIFLIITWLSASTILLSQGKPSSPDAHPVNTGLISKTEQAFKGYTLFSPIAATSTYLIDLDGRLVHSWECDYEPGQAVYLLENGHLLRTAFAGPGSNPTFHGGGSGGQIQEFSWEGDLLWDFRYNNKKHMLHHDIERLPNGNILMIAWEHKTNKQAVAAGRNRETVGDLGLWPDSVIEVKPAVKTKGQYLLEAGASFGPENPTWIYGASDKPDFYSGHISGAQRLTNGNTLICSGENGTLFEITRNGETVWKYANPIKLLPRPPAAGVKPSFPMPPPGKKKMSGVPDMPSPQNSIFRVIRYASSYKGLEGKDLTPKGSMEKEDAAPPLQKAIS